MNIWKVRANDRRCFVLRGLGVLLLLSSEDAVLVLSVLLRDHDLLGDAGGGVAEPTNA